MRCRGRWASSRGPATLRTRAKASRWSPSNGTTSRTPTSSRSGSSWPAWPRSVSGSPSSSPAPRADLRDRASAPGAEPGSRTALLPVCAAAASSLWTGRVRRHRPAASPEELGQAGRGSGAASLAGPGAAVPVAESRGSRALRAPRVPRSELRSALRPPRPNALGLLRRVFLSGEGLLMP